MQNPAAAQAAQGGAAAGGAAAGQQGGAAAANPEPEALRNLMVNYIPTTIDETQLRQIFEMYGPLETGVKIVMDRETRTSKGFGFVKYRHAFSAAHAIQYLNGYQLLNKRLKVGYANQAEAQRALAGAGASDPNMVAAAQQQYVQQMQQFAALQQMGAAAGGQQRFQ